jgi:16S rRNA processing protein RimM
MYKSEDKWVRLGFVRKPHGIRGFIAVEALTDFPEKRFFQGAVLHVLSDNGNVEELVLREIKPFKAGFLLRFDGFESIEDVERLRNSYLCLPITQREELDDDDFYVDQLVGLAAFSFEGERVGQVVEFESLPANPVFTIRGDSGVYDGGHFLVPFVKAAVSSVCLSEGRLTLTKGWVL